MYSHKSFTFNTLFNMKQLRLMMMLLASVLFFACSDDDICIQGEIDVPQEMDLMQLEMWSYEVPFSIKSNSEWRIETTGGLCYPLPAEGTGNATVKLCVVDNAEDSRQTGELRIIFPKDEKKNITLKLQQKYAGDYDDNAVDINKGNRVYAAGYGYNTTGGYANPESVKRPILKFAEMAEEELIVLGSVNANFHEKLYSGSSISQLSNDLSVSANVSGGFGKFKSEVTSSFNSNYFSSNNYEYALTFVDLAICYVHVEANLDEMRSEEYMEKKAYEAINGLSNTYPSTNEGFKRLINDYGTHLCINARLGGRVRHSMSVDISKVTDAYDISAYAEASYDGLFVSGGGSVDEKFKKSFEQNRKACDIQISVLGGNLDAALKLSTDFNKNNLDAWKSTVKEQDMALVAFSDSPADPSLLPLYELVDETLYPERAAKLKAYMEGEDIAMDYPPISMSYDCGTVTQFDVPSFSESGTLVKQVKIDGQVVAQICEEYIPVINKDKRVKVIYPVFNNQPRINMGFFIGNASHRPARIAWEESSLVVKEYSDMDMGEMKSVYIKGASVSTTPPEDGQKVVKGKIDDEFMGGYRGHKNSDYPIVKIFNNYWTKEDYRGLRYNDTHSINKDLIAGEKCYEGTVAQSKVIAPVGWRVPTSKDFETIASTLKANNMQQIGREFFPGGVLGFCVEAGGWYQKVDSEWKHKDHVTEADYWLSDKDYDVELRKDGGFKTDEWKRTNWALPLRFIKDGAAK